MLLVNVNRFLKVEKVKKGSFYSSDENYCNFSCDLGGLAFFVRKKCAISKKSGKNIYCRQYFTLHVVKIQILIMF